MKKQGKLRAIFIASRAGKPMERVERVEAVAGLGLKGDRYAEGSGSWNQGKIGKRQVTLINSVFFDQSGFEFSDSRRNIVTEGVELMALIGKEFMVGNVMMRGVKYCEPCDRPGVLSGKGDFRKAFHDRGGLIAEILIGGKIKPGDSVHVVQTQTPAQR